MNYKIGEVLENKKLALDIFQIKIKGKYSGEPGQFFMLRNWEKNPFFSRPLGIVDIDDESISFMYQVIGTGTERFSKLKAGDEIKLWGPLGNGFNKEEIVSKENIAIISAAVGMAPLYYTAKKFNLKGDFYQGFSDETYALDLLNNLDMEIFHTTETGISGEKGLITDIIDYDKYDLFIACGPLGMLKALEDLIPKEKDLIYSVDGIMACGYGVCGGCSKKAEDGYVKTCKDGPVFNRGEIELNG